MIKRFGRGFTLVEIMIVVVIIGLIVAVALSGYITIRNSSRKTVCITNLERIDVAIDQWALDNHVPDGMAISGSEEEIYSYVKGGLPVCPSGGEYTLNSTGIKPQVSCSKESEGHRLP